MASSQADAFPISQIVDYISVVLRLRGPTTVSQILNYIQISPYCCTVGTSVNEIECFMRCNPLHFRIKEDNINILGFGDTDNGSNRPICIKTVLPVSGYEINNVQPSRHYTGLIITQSLSDCTAEQLKENKVEFELDDVRVTSGLEKTPFLSNNEANRIIGTGESTSSQPISPSDPVATRTPMTAPESVDVLEGVKILKKALRENGPLPVRRLVGYLANVRKSIRDALGKNKEELLQFLLANDGFIVEGDDNLVYINTRSRSCSDKVNKSSGSRRSQDMGTSSSSTSVHFSSSEKSKQVVITTDLPHANLSQQNLDRVEGIRILTKALSRIGPMPHSSLLGNLSQTTQNVRDAIVGSFSSVLDFLRNDDHFIVLERDGKCIVHLNPVQSPTNVSIGKEPDIECFKSHDSDPTDLEFERSVLNVNKQLKMNMIDEESVANRSLIQTKQVATITKLSKNGKTGFALFDNGENIYIGMNLLKADMHNPFTNLNDRFAVLDRVCIHACIGDSSGSCKWQALEISRTMEIVNDSAHVENQDNLNTGSVILNMSKTTQQISSKHSTTLTFVNSQFANNSLSEESLIEVPVSSCTESKVEFIEAKLPEQESHESQGINILKQVLSERGALPAANLFGYFSKKSKFVREAIGRNPKELLQYLMNSKHFIVRGSNNLVDISPVHTKGFRNEESSSKAKPVVNEVKTTSTSISECTEQMFVTKSDAIIDSRNPNFEPLSTTKLNCETTASSQPAVDFLKKVLLDTGCMPMKPLKFILLNCCKPICDSFGENACMLSKFLHDHDEFEVEGNDEIVRIKTRSDKSIMCSVNDRSLSDNISTPKVKCDLASMDLASIESMVLERIKEMITDCGSISIKKLELVMFDDGPFHQTSLPEVLGGMKSIYGFQKEKLFKNENEKLIKDFISLHNDHFMIFNDNVYLAGSKECVTIMRNSMDIALKKPIKEQPSYFEKSSMQSSKFVNVTQEALIDISSKESALTNINECEHPEISVNSLTLQFIVNVIQMHGPISIKVLRKYEQWASKEVQEVLGKKKNKCHFSKERVKKFCGDNSQILSYDGKTKLIFMTKSPPVKETEQTIFLNDLSMYGLNNCVEIAKNEAFQMVSPAKTDQDIIKEYSLSRSSFVDNSSIELFGLQFLVGLINDYGPLSLADLNIHWPLASPKVWQCFGETSESSKLKRKKLRDFCLRHCNILNYTAKSVSLVESNSLNVNEILTISISDSENAANAEPVLLSAVNSNSNIEQKSLNSIISVIKRFGPMYIHELISLLLGKTPAPLDVLTHLSLTSDINLTTDARVKNFILKNSEQFAIHDEKVYLVNSKQHAALLSQIRLGSDSNAIAQEVGNKSVAQTKLPSLVSICSSTDGKGENKQTIAQKITVEADDVVVSDDQNQRGEVTPCSEENTPAEMLAVKFLERLLGAVGPLSFSEIDDVLDCADSRIRQLFRTYPKPNSLDKNKLKQFCEKHNDIFRCENLTVSHIETSKYCTFTRIYNPDRTAYCTKVHDSRRDMNPVPILDPVNNSAISTFPLNVSKKNKRKFLKENSGSIDNSIIENESLSCIVGIIKKCGPTYVSRLKQLLLGEARPKQRVSADVLSYLSGSSDINQFSTAKVRNFILGHSDEFDIQDGKVYLVNSKQYAALFAEDLHPDDLSLRLISLDIIRNMEADLVEDSALNFLIGLLRSHGTLSFSSVSSYQKLAPLEVRQYFGATSESPNFKKVKLLEFCDRHRDVLNYSENEVSLVHSVSGNELPVDEDALFASIDKQSSPREADECFKNAATKLSVDLDSKMTTTHVVPNKNVNTHLEETSAVSSVLELQALMFIKKLIRKSGPPYFKSLKSLLLGRKNYQEAMPLDVLIHLSGSDDVELLTPEILKQFILRHSDHIAKHDGKVYLVNSSQKASQIIQKLHRESILQEALMSNNAAACCNNQSNAYPEEFESESVHSIIAIKTQQDVDVVAFMNSTEMCNENINVLDPKVENLALEFLVGLIRSNGPLTFTTLSDSRHLASTEIQQLFGATSSRPFFMRKKVKEFCQRHCDVLFATSLLVISLVVMKRDELVLPLTSRAKSARESESYSSESQKSSKEKVKSKTVTTYDSLRMSPKI